MNRRYMKDIKISKGGITMENIIRMGGGDI